MLSASSGDMRMNAVHSSYKVTSQVVPKPVTYDETPDIPVFSHKHKVKMMRVVADNFF